MKQTGTGRRRSLVSLLALSGMLLLGAGSAGAAALMDVTPDFFSVPGFAGSEGGAFSPSSITYTVTNRGTAEALSWCVANSQPWLTVSTGCGVLQPGASANVSVSLDPSVTRALPADGYSDRLLFTNLTNHAVVSPDGSVSSAPIRRFVTLNVLGANTTPFQGFGAGTRGGTGGTVFHVTTLADNGNDANPVPGSLRDAVSQGNRHVVFDVAGTIVLQSILYVQADHITIDGSSAPAPGITLTRYGIVLRGNRGVHDVIVRDLRVRDIVRDPAGEQYDGIQIAYGAFNILVDHVSVYGADDGNIDITYDSHDVTVIWSILAFPKSGKNMLVKYHSSRVTLHHNLYLSADSRAPQIDNDDAWTLATDTTVDFRNNLIWDFGTIATRVSKGSRANVVNNYYSKAPFALVVNSLARAYTRGNVVHESTVDLNGLGTETVAFPAPPVDITDATTAASEVRAGAGARPRDAFDDALVTPVAVAALTQTTQVSVAVVKAGGGDGTIVSSPAVISCGTTCSGLVDEGTLLTLTATPATGSRFAGFSGGAGCATGQVTVSATLTCIATFELKADLVVSALSAPASAAPGGTITVQHTTLNRADTGPSIVTATRLYLSKNSTLDASDAPVASVSVGALAPGQSSAMATAVVVPSGTPAGVYYVLAQADALGVQPETSEINNTRSVRIVIGADVSIPSLVAPSTASPGGSIAVTVITANGPTAGPAAPSMTRLYLSRDTSPAPAEMIAQRAVGGLSPGARDTWLATVTIPAALPPGRYYVIARADDDAQVVETRETNNGRTRAMSITIQP